MSDGPDAAGGLDGDAGDGDFAGIDGDFAGMDGFGDAGGLDLDIDLSDCLMISHSMDGEWSDALPDQVCTRGGGAADINCRPNHARQLTEEQRRIVAKVANDPMRTLFAAHIVGHGFVNINKQFALLAQRLGCNRIDTVMPNFPSINSVSPELADWDRMSPPYTREKVPNGWYPGAFGSTQVIKQYWQIKKKGNFLFPDPEPMRRFDRFAGMVFEVVSVTWCYHEPEDYETKFQILVKTFPEWVASHSRWGIRRSPFQRYQPKAKLLVEEMAEILKGQSPGWRARMIRNMIKERLVEKDEPTGDESENPGGADPQPSDCSPKSGSGADMHSVLGSKSKTVELEFPL